MANTEDRGPGQTTPQRHNQRIPATGEVGDLPMVPQWVVGWDLNPSSWTQYSPETTWEARESTAGLPEGGTRNQNSSEQGGWFLCKGQVPWPCSLKASFRLPRLVPSSNSWDTEYCWPRLRLMLSLVQSDVIRGMFLGKRAQLFPHRDHRVKKKDGQDVYRLECVAEIVWPTCPNLSWTFPVLPWSSVPEDLLCFKTQSFASQVTLSPGPNQLVTIFQRHVSQS